MSVDRNTPELKAWYAVLDDQSYRLESPDAYHQALVSLAQALLDDGAIEWDNWLALKAMADEANTHAIEAAVEAKVDDPDT